MTEGCKGTVVVVTANDREGPSHTLLGVTTIIPDVAPDVTVMLLVPCPAVMLQPEGTVHVYVTPDTFVTL
jgi:hypothetical protein